MALSSIGNGPPEVPLKMIDKPPTKPWRAGYLEARMRMREIVRERVNHLLCNAYVHLWTIHTESPLRAAGRLHLNNSKLLPVMCE
jgi:hypothetical protein